MSRRAADSQDPGQECVPSPPLPPDHVLTSGAVLFPGAFDQHGCHLVVFPVEGQDRLGPDLSPAEAVDFISYFLRLHSRKRQKQSWASVVADLRPASTSTSRFIAETLLLLEHRRSVHSVYVVLPQRKDAAKLLVKLLTPSRSHAASFQRVFLKEVSELSNYIDRSQLTASLGGYFVYSHPSWVAFVKEMAAFVQDFVLVVQRLPSCISELQALSRLPPPSTFSELQRFCSTHEAKFQQLRRELGLDQLLHRCENVLQKLRHPEMEPCYQAMAGTALFTHASFDMLHNYSRITAAVEKVELLWQQVFSAARLQLQVFQLRDRALQITEQIETLLQEKLQPYRVEIARDAATAVLLASRFQASIHAPATELVRGAEDVVLALTSDGRSGESWVLDLERLKEKLRSAVNVLLQTLRAVCRYHQHYNKAHRWYALVLSENFLPELLSGVDAERTWGPVPPWRRRLSQFLKTSPAPSVEELLHLHHLSAVIPDEQVQESGRQMSQRCMTLRKLLTSSGPVSISHLQLALQWQYELFRGGRAVPASPPPVPPASAAVSGSTSGRGKPPSISSFDSGFDGAAVGHLEAWGGRDLSGVAGTRGPRDGSDSGASPDASIQIIPKATGGSLNLEIKVTRRAALPDNPWLSLPLDHLEDSYTVTIAPNPTPHPDASPPRDRCHLVEDEVSCPVLSSTVSDDGDKSLSATLLWDSYDLHQDEETIDLSLNDWDVKEQEGLKEVEKILERADEILEEEENVLAQEAELDALLSSDVWTLFCTEEHAGVGPSAQMSSSALGEAGVLGLGDPLDSDRLAATGSPREADWSEAASRSDLLTELQGVRLLDELIAEENVKLRCAPGRPVGGLPGREPLDAEETNDLQGRMEKEKREVEKEEAEKVRDDGPVTFLEGQLQPDECDGSQNATAETGPRPPDSEPRPISGGVGSKEPSGEVDAGPLEASSASEVKPGEAFDPGGEASPPVPDSPGSQLVLNPNVKEHRNNNNNNNHLPDNEHTSHARRVPGPRPAGVQVQLSGDGTQVSRFKTPIVLDTGSGLMKAGFADRDLPHVVFPTVIGRPKYEEVMTLEQDVYIGHEAQRMRGVLALKRPIKNGVIQNWDDMEKVWHHTFQQLGVNPEEHPVLLTEAAASPLRDRQRAMQVMFESFGVPLSYVAAQAVLALYAAGRSTGVVLDSGDGVTHSVPVFEGYCLPHAVQRLPLAGADVTAQLAKLLQEQGVCMRTTAEMEIAREMKEQCCYVALGRESESRGEMCYTLPDGRTLTLSSERFRAPEILFQPELIGRDHLGMHESVYKSILGSDVDLRRCLLNNILLSGGNTLLAGLPERLQAEIRGLLPGSQAAGVRVASPPGRDSSVWSGGAVLANLPALSCAWISREEYEEHGPGVVFRKCF